MLGIIPGQAVAQPTMGDTVHVAEGETVSEVSALAGSIIIEGTVTGDVSGAAGSVIIDGTVEGDVEVATGSLTINGQVGGDVSAGAGNVHIGEQGSIGGALEIGAGNVRIDGTVVGNAQIGASAIHLGETAEIGGSLTYDGSLSGNLDAVAGETVRDRTLGPTVGQEVQPLAEWLFTIYAFVLNLVLGGILLALFPRYSDSVSEIVRSQPVQSGIVGIGLLIGIPIFLLAMALTILGIPLMVIGVFLFLLVIWISLIYGRFAVGMWALGYFDQHNRYLGLFVGLLIAIILAQIPVLGGLVNFVIFVLGLGAVFSGLYRYYQRSRSNDRKMAS